MGKSSYSGKNIEHLVGSNFLVKNTYYPLISIVFNVETNRPMYKIDSTYFDTVNAVGWYLKGRHNGLASATDSKLRPDKLIEVSSGKTLKELVHPTTDEPTAAKLTKQKVYQPKKKLSHPYVDILPVRYRDAAKKVVTLTYKHGFADKQTFYSWMKEAGVKFFQDRKRIAYALIHDKIIVKEGEIYKLSEEIL